MVSPRKRDALQVRIIQVVCTRTLPNAGVTLVLDWESGEISKAREVGCKVDLPKVGHHRMLIG